MNETLSNEERQLLKAILLLFIAMVSIPGILLLLAIMFTQIQGPLMPRLKADHTWLLAGTAVVSFICTIFAKRHITKAVNTAKNSGDPLAGKLAKYRTALIVYMALSELPILICLTLSLLTGDFVFQVFAAILLGYLLAELPRKEKVLMKLL